MCPAYRRKDTGKIFVKFQINGVTYRQSVPEATSIAEGKIAEVRIKREIFEGKYGEGKDVLFSDFAANYFKPWWDGNFKSSVKYSLRMFSRTFKGKALKDISQLTIEAWKIKRASTNTHSGKPPHLATIQNELALLSSIFELACDNDFLPKNPMRKVRRYTQAQIVCQRSRLLDADEEVRLERVFEQRGGEVYWAYMIARYTGMRQMEILSLKHDDVDLVNWSLTIHKSKNDRPRTLPILDKLKPIFLSIPVNRDGYLFTRRTGCAYSGRSSAWGRACAEAGITDFRFHDLRHCFASSLPPDPYLRIAWLGHSKIETSTIYSHTPLEEMRRAAECGKVLDFERTSQSRHEEVKTRRIAKK